MKKILLLATLCCLSIACFAQSMGISFYDRKGREFVIYAPYGNFSYSMYEGDYISRDYNGRVSCVGDTYISYNYNGQVSQIGDVYISYTYDGRLSQVGGLYISYDYNGNIVSTSGRVH
jgi:hypothetical protein